MDEALKAVLKKGSEVAIIPEGPYVIPMLKSSSKQ